MLIPKRMKPSTPGQRHQVRVQLIQRPSLFSSELGLTEVPSYLTVPHKGHGGRNARGVITIRGRGGKQGRHHKVDSRVWNTVAEATVVGFVRDETHRSAPLARMVPSESGEPVSASMFLMVAPSGSRLFSRYYSGVIQEVPVSNGNRLRLGDVPPGTSVSVISRTESGAGTIKRTAGSFAKVVSLQDGMVTLKLGKGKEMTLSTECTCMVGSVAGSQHMRRVYGKAGVVRGQGRKPQVRGVAMNPVDHPHGGGEGKTSGGRPSVTPWGRLTRGPKTRK